MHSVDADCTPDALDIRVASYVFLSYDDYNRIFFFFFQYNIYDLNENLIG